jgi:hypothetical protein
MKKVLFFVLVGVICYLLSFGDERRSVQVLLPVDVPVKGKQVAPTKIEDTRVIGGRLNTLVSSHLTITTLQKQRHLIDMGAKTHLVWHNVNEKERIELTPERAVGFVKSRKCWVFVCVHKGIASSVIIHPVVDVNEFPDLD